MGNCGYLRLKKQKIAGIPFWLNLEDNGISKRLVKTKGRREPGYQWILKKEASGVAVDIGANIGWYTVLLSGLCEKVYAYEPDPRNWVVLLKNIRPNVVAMNMAVTNYTGEVMLHIAKRPNLSTVCSGGDFAVRCCPLSKHLPEADFIKMDVEGAEVSILGGAMEQLKEVAALKILVEVHPQFYNDKNDFSAVLKELVDAGYKFKYVVNAKDKIHAFKKFTCVKKFSYYRERAVWSGVPAETVIDWSTTMPEDGKKLIRSFLLCKS